MKTPSKASPWTILDLLRWITADFRDRRIESPRAGAEILLAHALGLRRIDLYIRYDQPLTPDERDRLRALIRRRRRREPVAYIVGKRDFWTLTLSVNPDVLIPRPDTESLVEAALDELPTDGATWRVLDLGTGSGAVILALAAERPGNRFFASDASPAALRVASDNARRLGPADAVAFFAGDWLEPVAPPPDGPGFHLIVSNPPYLTTSDIDGLAAEIRDHEPLAALDGGPDGLAAIGPIIRTAPDHLLPGGFLMLEIGADQADRVRRCFERDGRYEAVTIRTDLAGHHRVAVARRRDPG